MSDLVDLTSWGPNHGEDIVQESFLLAFQKLHHVRKPESFRCWLYRLVLHVGYRYRKEQPQWTELDHHPVPESNPEDVINAIQLQKSIGESEGRRQKHPYPQRGRLTLL